ncbi:hypothetical protein HGB07_07660 [Candidatus Roizmanbacteria bacterium]|nr:hypothetical protein [Candidatus Roizmanbacteria bacterium]
MYIIIDAIWNGLCAYATYRFFQTFLKNEKTAVLAFILAYFGSGISGMILLVKWIWGGVSAGLWAPQIITGGWSGENHSISHEFMDGNALTTMTIMSRVHYLMPRFFGLFSLVNFYEALEEEQIGSKKIIFSALFIFLAAFFHPASGQVFMVMMLILGGLMWLRCTDDSRRRSILAAGLIPVIGFLGAAAYWQIYRMNPNAGDMVTAYLQILHNTDLVTVWLAVFPMFALSLWIIFRRTPEKQFYFALLIATGFSTVGFSEFIVQGYNVKLRLLFLGLAFLTVAVTIWIKRSYLISLLSTTSEKIWIPVLFGIWFSAAVAIAASPHHDFRKMIHEGVLNLGGATPFVKKLSNLGNFVFAARFKLGIWLPLSGLCAYLIHEYLPERKRVVVSILFVIMLPSTVLYVFATSKSGNIPVAEYEAMRFLREQPNGNVMCAGQAGVFLPNIALMRCFGNAAADANVVKHRKDSERFWLSSTIEEQMPILKEYRIQYLYLSQEEQKLLKQPNLLTYYEKIYDKNGVQIFRVNNTITN